MKYAGIFLKLLVIVVITIQEIWLSSSITLNKIFLWIIDSTITITISYFLFRSINNIQIYTIYVYSIVTKISIIYFVSLPKYIMNKNHENILTISYYDIFSYKIFLVSKCILLLILVYIFLFYIINFSFLNIHNINNENAIFFVIIVQVTIDIIDISYFFCSSYFNFFLYYFRLKEEYYLYTQFDLFLHTSLNTQNIIQFYRNTLNIYEIMFIVYGVFISLNIFLHAYSLPSYSYETVIQKKGGAISNTLRSHQNYCMDNPEVYFIHFSPLNNNPHYNLNQYLSQKFFHSNSLEGRGIENIQKSEIFFSFQKNNKTKISQNNKFQLNVGGDAESCLKYITIFRLFFTDIPFLVARLFNFFLFSDAYAAQSLFIVKNICFIIINTSRMYRNSKYYKQNVNQKTKVDTKRRSENSEKNVYRLIGKESEDNNEEMDIEQIKYNFEKKKSISLLISSISSKKKIIKKESFNEKVDIYKINEETYNRPTNIIYNKIQKYYYFLYIKYNGIDLKKNISCYVDDIKTNSIKNIFLFIFFIFLIAIKITIIAIIFAFNIDDQLKKSLFQITHFHNIQNIELSLMLYIIFIIISVYAISAFLVYFFTYSLFEAIFMFILYISNLLSYSFVLFILSFSPPSYDIFVYFTPNKDILLILCVFIYEVKIKFANHFFITRLKYYYYFFIVLLQIHLFLSDSYMFIYMLLGGEYITYKYRIESNEQNNSKQNEEASVSISVISFMVVKIIKYMKAPILLNSIIIGNNLIKNTRLDNFLFFSHIKEIIIKLIIYFFCFFMFEKNDYINFLFLVALFSINIFISLLYLILSKIYRNAAMKSIIAQSIFSDINRGRIKETSMSHELDNLYTKYSYDHLILFNNSLNYF
ncbi:conserved Plasmodium membrane protein, unknown function [Plasmodium chabaudi adami]|uniref:Uncharacterized protein n=1 Tax=Plasmodium chabaudi adami TaxID=5826 RepID=A0A1C6XAU6_PLACE|nr:conserved Plasmodium membrane protein, unknown function [Plasmodium chabaudi adami]